MEPIINSQLPEFKVQAFQNGSFKTVSHEDVKGKWAIFFFYPADFTPGCTREACSFRDLHQELLKARLRVVGVSPQDVDSHQRFAQQHGLNFTLLADPGKEAVKAYDLDGPLGFGVRRGTYLIGRDGRIKDSVLADLRIGAHEAFVRKAIEAGAQRN